VKEPGARGSKDQEERPKEEFNTLEAMLEELSLTASLTTSDQTS
jgi:hypothetical protein